MSTTPEHDAKIAKLNFAEIYPLYLQKVQRKSRNEDELLQVLEWLTGFDSHQIKLKIERNETLEEFFDDATIHPKSELITGSICGYRIQDITTPLTRYTRYMDKLVDELAKGKSMDKIIRL